jgi:hypothetical protein
MVGAAALAAAPSARAGVTFYTSASAFGAAAPTATDPTGMSTVTTLAQSVALMEASPSTWRNTTALDYNPIVLGDLTFTAPFGGDALSQGFFYFGKGGIAGATYGIGNPIDEDHTIDIAGGAYAFGFKVYEPNNADCVVPCVSSSFTLTAYDAGGATLGSQLYVPGFSTIFMGFTSTVAVAKVTIDENYYGNINNFHCCMYDNEYFGEYRMVSAKPVPDTSGPGVPEPAAWTLMILGFGAVGAGLRRRREALA